MGTNIKCILTKVYGPHSTQYEIFIESLCWIHNWVNERHWVIGVDFNLITFLEEKKGQRHKLERESILFRDAIEYMK